jgi:23S rRNA (cytosine1962-C5)-methyltransferase
MLYPTPPFDDYKLLDSGRARKLEQFGPVRLIRPEERAVWKPALPPAEWRLADAEFVPAAKGVGGQWRASGELPGRWPLRYRELAFYAELVDSMQVGIFPENAAQWDWITQQVGTAGGSPRVLNLFGYTGIASLAAAQAGAQVTHIDSARRALRLGRDNQALSGIPAERIRWLEDDALGFVGREARRGNQYDGLILDPPAFGRGPKGERWEFAKHFPELCAAARDILSDAAAFVVVTAYAINAPPEMLRKPLQSLLKGREGTLELGELVTQERSAGRKLNLSLSARWNANGSTR